MENCLPLPIVHTILKQGNCVPDDFSSNLSKCAYFGIHKAKDICDYLGTDPLGLLTGLILEPKSVAVYKKSKIELRIDLLKSMSDIALNYDDLSRGNAITACKFLLSSLYKDTEQQATLDSSRKSQESRLRIEKEKLRLSKEAFEFSKDSFLANMASRCDKVTMEKIKTVIQSYYQKSSIPAQ